MLYWDMPVVEAGHSRWPPPGVSASLMCSKKTNPPLTDFPRGISIAVSPSRFARHGMVW